jgi:low temperature requirement protein LtrA
VSARSRFLEPPRLRTLAAGKEDERRATWLELFFDLVFVAAVGQLANALTAQPSPTRFFEFLALFVPVWWASMLGLAAIEAVSGRRMSEPDFRLRVGTLVLALVLILLDLSPLSTLVVLAVVLVAQVVYELARHEGREHEPEI